MVGIEQDVDGEAEDVALEIIGLEGELRPAVDRSPARSPKKPRQVGTGLGRRGG